MAIPSQLTADSPAESEGRIPAHSLGVIHIFEACQSAVRRLPQQVLQGELGLPTQAAISPVLIDQIAKSQPLIQLTNRNQAAVRGDA